MILKQLRQMRQVNQIKRVGQIKTVPSIVHPVTNPGVGTIITNWLKKFGIKAHMGCPCRALAAEMDRKGVQYIKEHFDEYVNKMVDSVKKWRKDRKLMPPVPRIAIETIIRWAIDKANKIEVDDPNLQL